MVDTTELGYFFLGMHGDNSSSCICIAYVRSAFGRKNGVHHVEQRCLVAPGKLTSVTFAGGQLAEASMVTLEFQTMDQRFPQPLVRNKLRKLHEQVSKNVMFSKVNKQPQLPGYISLPCGWWQQCRI